MTDKLKNKPKISVVMSVFNGEHYIRQAITSILDQSFRDFEFLIINDGSTDKSLEIVKSFNDPRIRVLSQENKGLTFSLNRALKEARADFIARMDADDISKRTRLEQQYRFILENKDYVLVGTRHLIINSAGKVIKDILVPAADSDIRRILFARNVFAHSSVMFRKDLAISVGGYLEEDGSAEDYGLWTRLSKLGKLANINEPLLLWRDNPTGISRSDKAKQERYAKLVRDKYWGNKEPEVKGLIWTIKQLITSGRYRDLISETQGRVGLEIVRRKSWLLGLSQILEAILINPTRISNYVYLTRCFFPEHIYLRLEKSAKNFKEARY